MKGMGRDSLGDGSHGHAAREFRARKGVGRQVFQPDAFDEGYAERVVAEKPIELVDDKLLVFLFCGLSNRRKYCTGRILPGYAVTRPS